MDPKYKRRLDVEQQMKRSRPDIPISYSMEDFEKSIREMIADRKDIP